MRLNITSPMINDDNDDDTQRERRGKGKKGKEKRRIRKTFDIFLKARFQDLLKFLCV